MFLDYFALGVLFFMVFTLFYGIIAIHDIPHLMAKARNHPHQDAIHVAGWVSLFTLHAIWPLVFLWAVAHKKPPHRAAAPTSAAVPDAALSDRIAQLEARIRKIEGAKK